MDLIRPRGSASARSRARARRARAPGSDASGLRSPRALSG